MRNRLCLRARMPMSLPAHLRHLLGFLGMLLLLSCRDIRLSAEQAATTSPPDEALETPAFGTPQPKVELLTFVDFECPHCRKQAQILQKLLELHSKTLRIRVLQLPQEVHPHALLAAQAAVAAAEQRAFPAFWKRWLQPEAELSRDALVAWAVESGLDSRLFLKALTGHETLKVVARDVAIAKALGVTGTPGFLLNGRILAGAQSLETLEALVKVELAETDKLLAAGARHSELVHARVLANAPTLADAYHHFVELAEPAPPQPVPVPVQLPASGVASVQLQPVALDRLGPPNRALLLANSPTTTDASVWRVLVRADDPQVGEANAPLTLVLFRDLLSEEGAVLAGKLMQLAQQNPKTLRLVMKHLPRPIHPQAWQLAEALEAAREQGQFWPMWQALTQLPEKAQIDAPFLLTLAEKLQLNRGQFQTSLLAHSGKPRIEADLQQAAALGIDSFAALYVNGVRLQPLEPEPLDALVAAQKATLTNPPQAYETLVAQGKLHPALGTEKHDFAVVGALQGNEHAPIVLTVFGDFQCPFTARLWPHLHQIQQEMPEKVQIQWLDFPARDRHPLAQELAEAGQEARAQGHFWPFMEALAREVDRLDDGSLLRAAKLANLNMKKLNTALKTHKWAQMVEKERQAGLEAKILGTPTLFLNGYLFQPAGGISAETLRPVLVQLLAADGL